MLCAHSQIRPCRAIALVGIAASLAGCAAPSRQANTQPFDPVRHQGESWEVVLSGPAALSADHGPGFEYERNDSRLGADTGWSYPLDAWPMPERPDLDRRGYITLPDDPGRVIYFRRDRGRYR